MTGSTSSINSIGGSGNTGGSGVPSVLSAAQTLTFTAAADTYVASDEPNTNFGTEKRLRLDKSPAARSFLRFNLHGLEAPVASATLYVYATSSSKDGYAVGAVGDDSWTETDLAYVNSPTVGAPVGSSGTIASKTWTQVDVSAIVKALASGSATLDLAMLATSETALVFSSREGTNPPILVVTTTAQPPSAVAPAEGASRGPGSQ